MGRKKVENMGRKKVEIKVENVVNKVQVDKEWDRHAKQKRATHSWTINSKKVDTVVEEQLFSTFCKNKKSVCPYDPYEVDHDWLQGL